MYTWLLKFGQVKNYFNFICLFFITIFTNIFSDNNKTISYDFSKYLVFAIN